MPQERDLFANFERMRREMDELFGDVLDRGLAPRRRGGFSPAVDVYYASDPPRAVVRADLPGIDPTAKPRVPRPTIASTSSSRSSAARSGA
jgi:HSP20 family protein